MTLPISAPDFTGYSVSELLVTHSALLEELRRRQVLRSANNPTGDYTEWLASTRLGLTLAAQSVKGYDAIDANGMRYQIKGRKVQGNGPAQLGVLRELPEKSFDFLVAIAFGQSWEVRYAAKIPHETVMHLGKFRKHINGHVMHLRPSVFENAEVEDISDLLR